MSTSIPDYSTLTKYIMQRFRTYTLLFCFAIFLFISDVHAQSVDPGRLYGRVMTRDGDTYEGLIRWDKNEVSWVDILDGSKDIERSPRDRDDRSRRRSIEIFGIEINYDDDDFDFSESRLSGIRFGHIVELEPLSRNRALLTLRSGERVEFSGGSTDIGSDIREIVVEDEEGRIELEWRDIDLIEFMPARLEVRSRFGERLYGTLTTRDGDTFTGYVCWDIDEVFGEDILDGRDEDGRDREIAFLEINRIARNSHSSALVELKSGREMILRGTNDVNSENRGILILDPAMGQVKVDWDDFDELVLTEADQSVTYNDFNSGELYGTVYDRDGNRYKGHIRWDDDEEFAWELLNGEMYDMEFDIEFGMIERIERRSSRSALVTLRDGRSFDLRGSNDVNDGNDGIFIMMDNGDEVLLDWHDFDRAVFDKP